MYRTIEDLLVRYASLVPVNVALDGLGIVLLVIVVGVYSQCVRRYSG